MRRNPASHAVTMRQLLCCALLLGSAVPCAAADPAPLGRPLGRLYLSPDPATYVPFLNVSAFAPFSIYLVAQIDFVQLGLPGQQARNGIASWETAVDLPAQVLALDRTLLPPTAVDLGPGDDNWIVSMTLPLLASETPQPLVRYDLVLLQAANDQILRIAPPQPSILADQYGQTAGPAWVEWADSGECGTPCVRPFVLPYAMTWVGVNCSEQCGASCDFYSGNIGPPGPGDVLRAGDVTRIEWSLFDGSGEGEGVSIEFSADLGLTWSSVAWAQPGDGSLDWTIPDVPTHSGLLALGSPLCVQPAGPFTILPRVVGNEPISWSALKWLYR